MYLLKRCDVVLIPYQRHVGSSGLLIWAASAGKPVITQDFGLIGALTRAYKLGQTVDTKNWHIVWQDLSRIQGGLEKWGLMGGKRPEKSIR